MPDTKCDQCRADDGLLLTQPHQRAGRTWVFCGWRNYLPTKKQRRQQQRQDVWFCHWSCLSGEGIRSDFSSIRKVVRTHSCTNTHARVQERIFDWLSYQCSTFISNWEWWGRGKKLVQLHHIKGLNERQSGTSLITNALSSAQIGGRGWLESCWKQNKSSHFNLQTLSFVPTWVD